MAYVKKIKDQNVEVMLFSFLGLQVWLWSFTGHFGTGG
jgi:hypothetical protein